MRFRKIVALSLAFTCLFFLFLPVEAVDGGVPIAPSYINTASIRGSLSFTGEMAECGAAAQGHYGTTKVSGTMTLQRRNSDGTYTDIKSWSASDNSDMLIINKIWFVEKGFYYRLYFLADVTRNGVTETVPWWSGDVWC